LTTNALNNLQNSFGSINQNLIKIQYYKAKLDCKDWVLQLSFKKILYESKKIKKTR